jgi:Transmembrane secretion effector
MACGFQRVPCSPNETIFACSQNPPQESPETRGFFEAVKFPSPQPSRVAQIKPQNVSAQVALPEWVRGRGLAMFVTTFFGALSLGNAIWGQLAAMISLPAALRDF